MKKTVIIVTSILVVILGVIVAIYCINSNKKNQIDEEVYYSVKFMNDDGSLIYNKRVLNGETVSKPTDPDRNGYTFLGWFYDNTEYDFNSIINKNIELIAKWSSLEETNETNETSTIKMYKVVFDSDGGTSVSSIEVKEGEKLSSPKNPTKKGFTFVEWQLNGKKYDFNNPISSNLELKAKWNNNSNSDSNETTATFYTVKFDSNGGNDIPSQKVKKGEKAIMPTNPTKRGYTFVEWQLNGKKYSFNNSINNDIELKAIWSSEQANTTNKYTVSFNTNGGNSISPQTVKSGDKATKPTNPTKSGYIFVEWQLNGQKYDFNTPVNNDITLTVKWTSSTFSIKYKGEMWPKVSVSDSSVVNYEIDNDLIKAVPVGIRGSEIRFAGLKPGKTNVTLLLASQFYGQDEFYLAKMEFNLTVKDDLTVIENSRKYIWGEKNCILTSSKSYDCDYNEYFTITFDSNGGTNVSEVVAYYHPILKDELPQNPTREGYIFKEWQLDGKKFDFNTTITKNITLVAVWEEQTNN